MILEQLSVGAKIRERTSGLVFLVGEHGHEGYPGTTLVANHVIGQGCLDAPEGNNPNQRLHLTGYNYYPFSNLHQWLNAEGLDWFRPTHEYDTAPSEEIISQRPNPYDRHGYNAYAGKAGFLSWFGDEFRDALLESDVACTNKEQSGIEYIKAKTFLLSTAEAGIRTPDPLREGTKIAVFGEFRNRLATPSIEAVAGAQWQPAYFTVKNLFWYWLRTPKGNDEGFTYYAHTTCPYGHKFACCPWLGVRPAVNVDSRLPVAASANTPGLYVAG